MQNFRNTHFYALNKTSPVRTYFHTHHVIALIIDYTFSIESAVSELTRCQIIVQLNNVRECF